MIIRGLPVRIFTPDAPENTRFTFIIILLFNSQGGLYVFRTTRIDETIEKKRLFVVFFVLLMIKHVKKRRCNDLRASLVTDSELWALIMFLCADGLSLSMRFERKKEKKRATDVYHKKKV